MSVFIICEAGVNHGGSMAEARRLIERAKSVGADAVKFQMFDWRKLNRPALEPLQLDADELAVLRFHCDEVGIEFMCTPFDIDAMAFLKHHVRRMKIASGFVTNLEFLKEAAKLDMPLIVSTGMASWSEVDAAWREFKSQSTIFLHCTSAYPCPIGEANLQAMLSLSRRLQSQTGLSDHTEGIHIALAAVGMGATIIEKHLTLDKYAEGPDHKASILPVEFAEMVRCIRDIEAAMGDGVKRPMPSEETVRKIWRA